MPFAFHYAARSDVGMVRSNNEDSAYAGPHLLAMADGMGGHAGGDVASSTVIAALVELDDEALGGRDVSQALLDRILAANAEIGEQVRDDPKLDGMGTTLIALLRARDKIVLAHIGDSRAFMVRDGVVTQITKDHSFVQNLVDEGRISSSDAHTHPQRSLVTRVLTGAHDDEPDLVVRQGRIGDRYLIASDGLTDYVARDTVDEILTTEKDPGECADRLVSLALRAGAPDNVTVVVGDLVDINRTMTPPTQPQVVGAAAVRERGTRPIPTTPAAKAAALTAAATGGDREPDDGVVLAEEGPRSRRTTVLRVAALLVVAAVVLAGGSYAAYAWSQQRYFLAEQDGVVTVFRGVDQTVGPVALSHRRPAAIAHLDGGALMSVISSYTPRRGRNVELVLLIAAVAIVMLAYVNVGLATSGTVPPALLALGGGYLGVAVALPLLLRWRASYADPLMLPIVTLLNGLGLVMLHRLDLASDRSITEGVALRQLMLSALAVAIAAVVLVLLRDHRILRRYTYLAGAIGFFLLVLPLFPVIGTSIYGSRIWIQIGPFSFQPGELAKIALAIFFAGYLVQTRDALSVAGRKVLGLTLPRARDLGPILVAWLASLAVLVFERDLGSSLLFFGLFVAMLYVATERVSWIAIGLTLFGIGAYTAYLIFGHVQTRVLLWLDTFSPEALAASDQLAKGLMGMASGGVFGTGLGRGRPHLTYFAESDFIIPSFGEEIGLIGLFAIVVLYGLLVERGLRTSLGTRDGFGKLLAAGLSFSLALQCFVVVGGGTRGIPPTGVTMPVLSSR